MIDVQLEASRNVRQYWSGHVRERIHALDLDDRASASAISESLAVVCEQQTYMPEHTLSLLIARSFCAMGDAEAASRILCDDQCYCEHAGTWVNALSAEYPFPELYPLFSSRVLHPLHLKTVGDSATWVLDLQKLQITPADRHELILSQTLRVLVEKVSNVWKKTDGEGALAVKGLSRLEAFLGPRSTLNLSAYLRDVLDSCAGKNGWATHPVILLLDL
jgi:hypothetical protein